MLLATDKSKDIAITRPVRLLSLTNQKILPQLDDAGVTNESKDVVADESKDIATTNTDKLKDVAKTDESKGASATGVNIQDNPSYDMY